MKISELKKYLTSCALNSDYGNSSGMNKLGFI